MRKLLPAALVLVLTGTSFITACQSSATKETVSVSIASDPIQQERDLILSLTAMAVVRADWQDDGTGRGHNIGSVLADAKGIPVFWARNASRRLDNGSQHGEVRLIQNFLNCKGIGRYAKGYTVYTTLEPCAMCTGLMILTQVTRVVYVQEDPGYGDTAEALRTIDYPNVFEEATVPANPVKGTLEAGFEAFNKDGSQSITVYLLTPEAKAAYDQAVDALADFKVVHAENRATLAAAQKLASSDLTELYGDDMDRLCPVKVPKSRTVRTGFTSANEPTPRHRSA